MMKERSGRHLLLTICLLLIVYPLQSLGLASQKPDPPHYVTPDNGVLGLSRRGFATASATLVGTFLHSEPALAVKERNEMLCGTGFFTNIAQYMCTDIGDISDEGRSKNFDKKELGSMDSLMSKMGVTEVADDVQQEMSPKKDVGGREKK
jgi:hypothetical protein